MKVGTVFDVELRLERNPTTRELIEQPHAVNMTDAAVLGSVEQFAPARWHLVVEHQVPRGCISSLMADGAEGFGIWLPITFQTLSRLLIGFMLASVLRWRLRRSIPLPQPKLNAGSTSDLTDAPLHQQMGAASCQMAQGYSWEAATRQYVEQAEQISHK